MKLLQRSCAFGEALPLIPQVIDAAGGSDDTEDVVDLHQDITDDDSRREGSRQSFLVEAEIVVFLPRVEEEHVGHALLGDKSFQVTHVGVADAGSPSP
jgi:hypothetical protein